MSDNRASVPQQRTTGKLARFWAAHHRIFMCLLVCLLSHPLWAQDGQFYAVVTDQGGSAVPHGKVVRQNTGDFGQVTGANAGRIGQGALRLVF